MLNRKPYITPLYPAFKFLKDNNVITIENDKTIRRFNLPDELVKFFIEFRKFSSKYNLFNFELVIILPNGNFYEKIIKLNSRL